MTNQPTIQDLRVLAARIVERISQCSVPMRGVPIELSDCGIGIRLEKLDGSMFVDGAIQIGFGACGGRYEGGIAAWLGGCISPGPERVALLPDEFHRIDDFIREAVRIRAELRRDVPAEAEFVVPENTDRLTVTLPSGAKATVAEVMANIEKLQKRSKVYRAEAAAELELYSKGRWPDGKPVGQKERMGCFDNAADLEGKADHEEGVARNLRRLVYEAITTAKPIAVPADSPAAALIAFIGKHDSTPVLGWTSTKRLAAFDDAVLDKLAADWGIADADEAEAHLLAEFGDIRMEPGPAYAEVVQRTTDNLPEAMTGAMAMVWTIRNRLTADTPVGIHVTEGTELTAVAVCGPLTTVRIALGRAVDKAADTVCTVADLRLRDGHVEAARHVLGLLRTGNRTSEPPHIVGYVVSDASGDYDIGRLHGDRAEAEAIVRAETDALDHDWDNEGGGWAVGAVLSDGTVTFET